ncbi:hypothetical protein [Paenibacillus harenae]|uniref:Uncharacterized protein n=1 Tax=Paenibacillus harenae TaxID=306543 RepID=A0ABT9U0Y4_PAEHA|nr:hypothetical protein [Paenibacillus harenae]MDQ0059502.1 hypothetical protein [Paenibacillus harenae]MDQ0112917.1 hypothetical protein [Paenibacillus harenae]
MAEQYAYLAIWLIGMFGIIGIVIGSVAKFVRDDSLAYDEQFIWRRKLGKDGSKKR